MEENTPLTEHRYGYSDPHAYETLEAFSIETEKARDYSTAPSGQN